MMMSAPGEADLPLLHGGLPTFSRSAATRCSSTSNACRSRSSSSSDSCCGSPPLGGGGGCLAGGGGGIAPGPHRPHSPPGSPPGPHTAAHSAQTLAPCPPTSWVVEVEARAGRGQAPHHRGARSQSAPAVPCTLSPPSQGHGLRTRWGGPQHSGRRHTCRHPVP